MGLQKSKANDNTESEVILIDLFKLDYTFPEEMCMCMCINQSTYYIF